jgi:hypothetical protein
MAKISIFKVLEARKRIRLITVLASAIVIVLLLQGFVLNNPKSSKAGVSEAAGVVTIDGSDGSIYTVDPDGYLYRFSNALLEDYDSYYNSYDTPLDVGFQAATGYSVLTSYQLKDKACGPVKPTLDSFWQVVFIVASSSASFVFTLFCVCISWLTISCLAAADWLSFVAA